MLFIYSVLIFFILIVNYCFSVFKGCGSVQGALNILQHFFVYVGILFGCFNTPMAE